MGGTPLFLFGALHIKNELWSLYLSVRYLLLWKIPQTFSFVGRWTCSIVIVSDQFHGITNLARVYCYSFVIKCLAFEIYLNGNQSSGTCFYSKTHRKHKKLFDCKQCHIHVFKGFCFFGFCLKVCKSSWQRTNGKSHEQDKIVLHTKRSSSCHLLKKKQHHWSNTEYKLQS